MADERWDAIPSAQRWFSTQASTADRWFSIPDTFATAERWERYRGAFEAVSLQNVPTVDTISGKTFDLRNEPGRSTTLSIKVNGVLLTATSPVSIDASTTGLGGIEISSDPIAADTFYYVYAAQHATPGQFDAFISSKAPDVGPDDFDPATYIGSLRTDGGANFFDMRWRQGGLATYPIRIEPAASAALGGTLHTPRINLSVADYIPPVADEWLCSFELIRDGTGGFNVESRIYIDGESTAWDNILVVNNAWGGTNKYVPVPLAIGATTRIQYESFRTGGSGGIALQKLYVHGYHDAYRPIF